MSLLKRIMTRVGWLINPSTYITLRRTELKKSSGKLSGVTIAEGFVIEADWLWDKDPLTGYRKIVSGPYIDYFVNDNDIMLFTDNPPEELAYVILYEPDGTTRRFDEV